ncbi:MAG: hypothetical protein ACREBG_29845 [Pyrinomonadaceae bacterium]
MRNHRKQSVVMIISTVAAFFAGCSGDRDNANTTATTTVTPPTVQVLQVVPRPQKIVDEMKARGEQDQATPQLKILSPVAGSVAEGPVVAVRLSLSGDLKGYRPHKDPVTEKGNHIHVILDNEPYEAYYDLDQPFELRNVVAGKHTLSVFPSRPWHESYKNDGAFQLIAFTVKGGGDARKPTTTNTGQIMANNNAAGSSASPREGKQVGPITAADVDPTKPLLTPPKGEYKGPEAEAIMIDFWLSNARLKGDGGEYRVRYIVDDDEPRFIDKWEPIWLSGWLNGKHTVRLELLGDDQFPVKNGDFNVTTREIVVTK